MTKGGPKIIKVANENPPPLMNDWFTKTTSFLLVWGIPIIAVITANALDPAKHISNYIFSGALFYMGLTALINAKKCGRTHCYFTGPWLLLASIIPFLEGAGVLSLPLNIWNIFATFTILGTPVIWIVSEKMMGRYWR